MAADRLHIRDMIHRHLPGWMNGPLLLLIILGAVAGGWYTMFGDQGLVTLRALRTQLTAAQREEGQLRERIQQLTTEQTRLQSPAYLEQVIRRELGYVKPNERLYQFATTATEPAAPTVPNTIPALAVTPPSTATTPSKSDKVPVKTKTSKQPAKQAPRPSAKRSAPR